MSAEGLSPAVSTFLREHVRSLELLEVLLFLHRYPEAAFDVDAIAAELRLQPRSVGTRCEALAAEGICVNHGGKYKFADKSPHAPVVAELAQAWASHRVRVIETIFSRPADNIRIFADAFVIGKKRPTDG